MRTTLSMNEQLFRLAKARAAQTGRTLTAVVEDALRSLLLDAGKTAPPPKFRLPVFKGRGVQPGVNLNSTAELLDRMDGVL